MTLPVSPTSWDMVMYHAVINHDIGSYMRAMENGVAPHHLFNSGYPTFKTITLIKHIVEDDFCEGLRALLRGPYVSRMCALYEACRKNKQKVIKVFLQHAAEFHQDCTESLFVLLDTGLLETAQSFVDMKGFDVDDQTFTIKGKYLRSAYGRAGMSPLHVSALLERPAIVEQLLKKGAVLDLLDEKGYSALFYSCMVGNYDTCRLLVKHGAEVSYPVVQGDMNNPRSPLYAACCLSTNSQMNDKAADLLVAAGVVIRQETWISNEKKLYVCERIVNKLKEKLETLPRIDMLCCHKIRSTLKARSGGKSILSMVKELPLLESELDLFFFV